MPKSALVRKNQSFLKQVYHIGNKLNPEIKIEDEAMIQIYECMEELMRKEILYAVKLCKMEGSRRVSEAHLDRVSEYVSILALPLKEVRTKKITDPLLKKQERVLEVRKELRLQEMEKQRKETLKRLTKKRRQMKKSIREKKKWFKRMRL